MNSMVVRIEHRQQQKLSPRLQQAVRLLQLSSLDFKQEIDALLDENPFLEADDTEDIPADPDAVTEDKSEALDSVATSADSVDNAPDFPAAEDPFSSESEPLEDRDSWSNELSCQTSAPGNDGADAHPLNLMAVESSLSSHLHSQLNVLPLPLRDLVLAKAIVECLDDDGYLRMPLHDLIGIAELDPVASAEEVQIALRRVQSLEPAGVGARDVAECLRLQLPSIDDEAEREVARRIVDEGLQLLATQDAQGLARKLSIDLPQIEAACARIRRLDPHPGWRCGSTPVAYIVPDIIVKKVQGQWSAQLNPAIVPRVRVNNLYAELFQRHAASHGNNPAMAVNLREAHWTIRNVEQRFATILAVAQSIVKRQKAFFDLGVLAMKPLGLREIADEIGVHESTVSRVTNNKFMSAPHGVLELKYFFSRAMTARSGAAFSGTAIRGLVKDMIEAEPSNAPLSDAEITRRLTLQGLVVARRTVTKYRQQLHLAPVEQRKRLGQQMAA